MACSVALFYKIVKKAQKKQGRGNHRLMCYCQALNAGPRIGGRVEVGVIGVREGANGSRSVPNRHHHTHTHTGSVTRRQNRLYSSFECSIRGGEVAH